MRKNFLKFITLGMFVATGVVISPILRIEGMCPTAHLINIMCAVLLGPYYALACALSVGIIRMITMGIPPIAITGAIFGAFFSGLLYKASKGRLMAAVFGEIIGTGIIGSIISYPVMRFIWGYGELTVFYYTPRFIGATLIGGCIAYIVLKSLSTSGALVKMQKELGGRYYERIPKNIKKI